MQELQLIFKLRRNKNDIQKENIANYNGSDAGVCHDANVCFRSR